MVQIKEKRENEDSSYEDLQEDLYLDVPSPDRSEQIYNYSRPSSYGYQQPGQQMPQPQSTNMQEIVEALVDEKWNEFNLKFGDFNIWKDKIETDIVAIKQEIFRVNARFENLQKALLGKISDYNKNIDSMSSDIKALEKVFQKIIDPLTQNIKDLERITSNLKKKTK